ncbi:MAG: choice-of-anchor tandem repeat GloVer-containing protein [Verrucomicrobiota bacterium]
MKPRVHIRAWLVLAATGLVLTAARLTAQTLAVLHAFTPDNAMTMNLDGAYPEAGLVLSSNTLYGTANVGGSNNLGTVFSVATDGSGFTVLHAFAGTNVVNVEGAHPVGTLVWSGNTLYGAASEGGTNGFGTLFSIAADGSAFTVLHTFATNLPDASNHSVETNADGSYPNSLVLSAAGTLYGTASQGGSNGWGTLFAMNTNGSDFSVLHIFKPKDGEYPQGGLLLSGDTLYGTAREGGTNGYGTIFSCNLTDGTFTNLHTFSQTANGTNADGAYPEGGLAVSGNTLYGTASEGGTNGNGVIYSIGTNGANFTILYTFSAASAGNETNPDGAQPEGALLLAGNILYGTATVGGNNWGTIFSVNTNGSGFTTLYTFPPLQFATNYDGAEPETGVILCGATLFGTAHYGGNAFGTVFALPIVPAISSFSLAGTNLTLNVENGVAGETCSVVAAANVSLPLSQWTPVATNGLTAGGSFTLTATNAVNPSAPWQFYSVRMQ